MGGLWSGFFANLFSDALLGVAVFVMITRPGERRRASTRRMQALGLLKTEIETNRSRVRSIQHAIKSGGEAELDCPMHFTRGAWLALRDAGFISELDDPQLAYLMFRMNEITSEANTNLRIWYRAGFGDKSKRTEGLREVCLGNLDFLAPAMDVVLMKLAHVRTVSPDELS